MDVFALNFLSSSHQGTFISRWIGGSGAFWTNGSRAEGPVRKGAGGSRGDGAAPPPQPRVAAEGLVQ